MFPRWAAESSFRILSSKTKGPDAQDTASIHALPQFAGSSVSRFSMIYLNGDHFPVKKMAQISHSDTVRAGGDRSNRIILVTNGVTTPAVHGLAAPLVDDSLFTGTDHFSKAKTEMHERCDMGSTDILRKSLTNLEMLV
jgi:hypothetical protein